MNKKRRPIIAIDFDGVIVKDKYPAIGKPMRGVKKSIERLSRTCDIIIWTCRDGQHLDEAVAWLDSHEIPYDYINQNTTKNVKRHGGDTRKVFADIYIDDRQVGGFTGWRTTLVKVLRQLRGW